MILQVDAGNSRIHWRLLDDRRGIRARGDLLWETLPAEGLNGVDLGTVNKLEFASVAGERIDGLQAMLERNSGAGVRHFAVSPEQCGVVNAYSDPYRMGVDRWLAMIGAFRVFEGPLTVLDAGTAITIDHVDVQGVHQGGYILPGVHLMETSLGAGTSGVRTEPGGACATVPGRSTSECVHHGVAWLLEAMVARAEEYWGSLGQVIATGGDANRLTGGSGVSVVREPDLVFLGMDTVIADERSSY